MKQFTVDELGVLLDLVRRYARECESDYYEAANEDSKPRRLKTLKMRWEAMDALYDRMFEMFNENFDMPADIVDDMRFEDKFEKRLVDSYAKSERALVGTGRIY